MVLIQLLLPTSADGLAPLAETRRELADRFNGLTAYLRSPAKGLWTAPDDQTELDLPRVAAASAVTILT